MASLIGGWRNAVPLRAGGLGRGGPFARLRLGVFALGYAVYRKLSWRFAEVL
jgi:hypothetical protein